LRWRFQGRHAATQSIHSLARAVVHNGIHYRRRGLNCGNDLRRIASSSINLKPREPHRNLLSQASASNHNLETLKTSSNPKLLQPFKKPKNPKTHKISRSCKLQHSAKILNPKIYWLLQAPRSYLILEAKFMLHQEPMIAFEARLNYMNPDARHLIIP
jgi:hypothetical protein